MRSIILRLILVLAALAMVPDALAADTDSGSIFVDAKDGKIIGKPLGTGYSTGDQTSWGADGGYLWNLDDSSLLGFEAGYMHFGTVGKSAGNSGIDRISASALSLGAHFVYSLGEDKATFFQARGGLASVNFDDDITSFFGPGGTDSWRQNGVYFGVGIGRRITQGFSVILAYSYYGAAASTTRRATDLTLHWLGLAAEYRF